jgi:hypothetical protein
MRRSISVLPGQIRRVCLRAQQDERAVHRQLVSIVRQYIILERAAIEGCFPARLQIDVRQPGLGLINPMGDRGPAGPRLK